MFSRFSVRSEWQAKVKVPNTTTIDLFHFVHFKCSSSSSLLNVGLTCLFSLILCLLTSKHTLVSNRKRIKACIFAGQAYNTSFTTFLTFLANKLRTKSLESLLIWLFLENVVKSVKSVKSLKSHVFTFPTTSMPLPTNYRIFSSLFRVAKCSCELCSDLVIPHKYY